MSVVELNQVKKNFGSLAIIKNLSLTLDGGEVLGLFGHNGAGKTTTMKMILGLISPCAGQVKVFGADPAQAAFSHFRYRLGFLPENVSFYQQLTGYEVLSFFARLKKVSNQSCLDLLAQLGLTHAKDRKVKTYSKGMKQRLGLAQALLTEPSLLLLDEPTVGLDPIATQDFYHIVDDLKQKGCSIILCSHVLPGVEKHIDRAAILSQGELKAYGSLADLRSQTELPTQIVFSGYFEMEELSKKLGLSIESDQSGNFEVNTSASQKMAVIKTLMSQPGLKNIDTRPPTLEQLYRHYLTQDHQVITFPNQSSQAKITAREASHES